MVPKQLHPTNKKDDNMNVIGFIFCSLLTTYFIWGYKYAKKKEAEGEVMIPPSQANIGPIIYFSIIAIVCFLYMTGLMDPIVEWLRNVE